MVIVLESLNYYRAYLNSLPKKYSLSGIKELAKDGTTFHKCISVSNSSWMSTSSLFMGTALGYQHNKSYAWGYSYKDTTSRNTYSDSLFHILKNNNYRVASFSSPNHNDHPGYKLFKFDLVDDQDKRIDSILGSDEVYSFNTKKEHFSSMTSFLEKNINNKFAIMSWSYLDHLALHKNKNPLGRITSFEETSDYLNNIFNKLKELGIYEKTDIYIIGDHGDTFYLNSDLTQEKDAQHGTLPLHITTHVPLIIKNDYIDKGDRYDLVSNIDIYSTILTSLKIPFSIKKDIPKNLFSIDLKNIELRDYVLSQNKFILQDAGGNLDGTAITSKDYCYLYSKDKEYLFYHILDIVNTSDLLQGFKKEGSTVHFKSWFHNPFMENLENKIIPYFKELLLELQKEKYVRKY